jgi:hypothetical protein
MYIAPMIPECCMLTLLFLRLFSSLLHRCHLECQRTIKNTTTTTTHIHKENVKNLPTTSPKPTLQQTPELDIRSRNPT